MPRVAAIALLLLTLLAGPIRADEPAAEQRAEPSEPAAQAPEESLAPEQVRALEALLERVRTVDDLEARARIGPELAREERARYLGQAAQITSAASSEEALGALCERERERLSRLTQGDSRLSRVWGWFSFVHVVWLIVGVLLVVALGWLASLYVVPLLKRLPPSVIEAALYLACATAIFAPAYLFSGGGVYALAVTGCIGLVPLALWSNALHVRRTDELVLRVIASFLGVAWGAAAVFHGNSEIATFSLIAFSLLTGTVVVPILGAASFLEERFVPSIMLIALGLLGFFATLTFTGQRVPYVQEAIEVFRPGSLWLGTLVYFGGCLVICSRRYHGQADLRFWLAQLVAVGSGVLGLYVGSVFEVDVVRESAGSYLALYLGVKFFDLPWKKERWAWGCLLLALLLWGVATFMERYPSYFLGL